MAVTSIYAINSYSHVSSSIIVIMTLTPQYLDKEQVCLKKDKRDFNDKNKWHTAHDCLKKRKIAIILNSAIEEYNNQEKKYLFSKTRKKAYLFLYYLSLKIYFMRVILLFYIH